MKKGLYRKSGKAGPRGIRCTCCGVVPRGKNNSCKTNKVFMSKLLRRSFKHRDEEE